MARRGRKKKDKEINVKSDETRIFFGLLLSILGIASILSPFFDSRIFRFLSGWVGFGAIPLGVALLFLALRLLTKIEKFKSWKIPVGLFLFFVTFSTFLLFWVPNSTLESATDFSSTGGSLGYSIHLFLLTSVGKLLEFIVLTIMFVIAISLITNVKLEQIRDFVVKLFEPSNAGAGKELNDMKMKLSQEEEERDEDAERRLDKLLDNEETLTGKAREEIVTPDKVPVQEEMFPAENEPTKPDNAESELENQEPKYVNWKFPEVALLQDPVIQPRDKSLYKKNALVIEQTLKSFGIQAKVVEVSVGPTVVQYALSIAVGIKVSKIRNLNNDLALALAAPSSAVRIETPIPGTSLVGIEAPNPTPNFVYIKEMIKKLQKEDKNYQLPIVLGEDVAGKKIVKDLVDLPHLLVAGATGTGKSVGINSILMGLLMTKSPDEVKFILVDPKMVEMAPYGGIPHLLTPVITDMELVVNALQWAIEEMLKRYRMLKHVGVKKISEYNKKLGYTAMPYIVIVIDEMADLMLSSGVEVEQKIVRLAQMARAVGIHLILATQRPSVDVITGLIKANIPGRVAFAVTTAIDSRVIIDQIGAESLLGNGDMLFKSPAHPRPFRIQGAFTDTKDMDEVINVIKSQVREDIEYEEEVVADRQSEEEAKKNGEISGDPMARKAVEVLISEKKASASLLQRRLSIGYNRAARLIDELEEAGAIGPRDGSKPRKVLISSADQLFKESKNDGNLPQ